MKGVTFCCDICGKSSKRKAQIACHITALHFCIRPFQCLFCSIDFSTNGRLKRHISIIHRKDDKTVDERHCCDFCEKTFTQKRSLSQHLMSAHFGIKRKPRIVSHMNTNISRRKRKYCCDICDKSFNYGKGEIARHIMTVHFGIKQFKCIICLKRFNSLESLARHSSVAQHNKGKLFYCDICGHESATKTNLFRHIKHVHFGITPYHCSFCISTFASRGNLKKHIWRFHGRKEENYEKRYSCDMCHYGNNSKFCLQNHIITHFGIRSKVKCNVCSRLLTKPGLKYHILSFHSDKIQSENYYICDKCDLKCITRSHLMEHFRHIGTHLSKGMQTK